MQSASRRAQGHATTVQAAASKNASCCRCAKRRADIRDRYHPLPSSRPLARSPCDHTTRPRLADGEAGKIPCLGFYGDRICGTSRSDQSELSNRQFVFPPGAGLGCFCSLICPPVGTLAEIFGVGFFPVSVSVPTIHWFSAGFTRQWRLEFYVRRNLQLAFCRYSRECFGLLRRAGLFSAEQQPQGFGNRPSKLRGGSDRDIQAGSLRQQCLTG